MQTQPAQVVDNTQQAIPGSHALLWGNNAAWICTKCSNLLGNRTGDHDFAVTCNCGIRYEILRGQNVNGNLDLGPALGVMRV